MQHEQSTSAPRADVPSLPIEQRVVEPTRATIAASEQRIIEQFLAANAALLSQLKGRPTTITTTSQPLSIPAGTTPEPEGGEAAP
jgi:hypothetical protein